MNEYQYGNRITLAGTITEDIKPDLLYYGVLYYKTIIEVKRPNGVIDKIPIIAKKKQFKKCKAKVGSRVYLEGVVETRDEIEKDGTRHVKIYVRAKNLEWIRKGRDRNELYLKGMTYDEPYCQILETCRNKVCFIMEVKDTDGDTYSYIPCIAWGKIADILSPKHEQEDIAFVGQFRSRNYKKGEEKEEGIVYEILVSGLI